LVKPPGTKRLPGTGTHHSHRKMLNDGYVMGEATATAIGCDLAGVEQPKDLFVVNAVPWF
jgi:hypothetical protein